MIYTILNIAGIISGDIQLNSGDSVEKNVINEEVKVVVEEVEKWQ